MQIDVGLEPIMEKCYSHAVEIPAFFASLDSEPRSKGLFEIGKL
jgi:hypothetical protein